MAMAEKDGQEVGFQDGGCFSRFLQQEWTQQLDIYNIPKLIVVRFRVRMSFRNNIRAWLLIRCRFKNLKKQPPS